MSSTPESDLPEIVADIAHENIPPESIPSPILTDFHDTAAPAYTITISESPLLRALSPWKLLIILIICMVFRGLMNIDSNEDITQSESLEHVLSAITDTKQAYAEYVTLVNPLINHRSAAQNRVSPVKAAGDHIEKAIRSWHKVVDSKQPNANDWRRLGITLAAFGRKGADDAFLKAEAVVPNNFKATPGKLSKHGSQKIFMAVNQHPMSAEKEALLWDALYGKHLPAVSERTELVAQLKMFKLGWFEKLARAQLQTRTGDILAAQKLQESAVEAAKAGATVTTLEAAVAITGLLMWIRLGIKSVLNKFDVVPAKFSHSFQKSTIIDYQTGLVGFMLYFLSMTFIGLPFAFFKPLFLKMAPAQFMHIQLLLQLVLYIPIVGITLGGMKAVCSLKTGKNISWKRLFVELGFRSDNLMNEIGAGVRGFVLILPVFLVTASLSQLIFSKYHTPMNPAQLEIFAVQNIWDRIALVLGVAVAGPIVEELIFRGVLFQALLNRFRLVPSMLISGAVFALVHPTLPAGFLPIWILGSGFAYIFSRRNSLVANIVMHCLHNGLIIATGFAMMSK